MSRSESRPGADDTRDDFPYDEFADVTTELALALPPVQPSAELKARLMAQVALTPQLPAETDADETGADATGTDAPAAEEAAPTAGLAPVTPLAPLPTPATDAPLASPAAERARLRWFQRPVVTLTAAAAAVALFFGGVVTANLLQPGPDDAAQQLAAIVAAPDVQTVAAPVADGGSATLVSSESLGLSAMVFEGLPELDADEAYALWYITDGTPTPAGLFTVSGDGEGEVVQVLDGAFEAGTIVGVTVEPASGSPAPTTEPIVAIPTQA
ncbi:anti-sigma factor [Microcella alkalica]|uniref:anti-sigma factor n=1 Tax=Microcella alkalica TaxID=355930 RepID=UPI00145E3F83|nr:anti-sigma factor [Microcella alkalica]